VIMHPIKDQGGWLTPFQAMSANKPVIISEEATCSSIFKKNTIGYIGDYVKNILDIHSLVSGRNEAEWVKENLSWDKYAEGMLKAFQEAVYYQGGDDE